MDFGTYARWRLPKLEVAGSPGVIDDVGRINTSGAEHGPVPVGDGSVLYFGARLRRPVEPEGEWIGAKRDGLRPPRTEERSFERSYRSELGPDGWSVPALVDFPNLDDAEQIQVTWVSDDELRCFVTVADPDGAPWVGTAERANAGAPWGEVVPFAPAAGGDAFGAVAMTGSPDKTVFVSTRAGGGDLYLHDPAAEPARPLQPAINSAELEWCPQVGPANELYFVRGDRQLRFQGGAVHHVRAPGPHRTVLIEASPTSNGTWLFLVAPKLRPVELDFDIVVAPLAPDGSLGEPIPVDDWRP
jgi:hypothetical protein